MRVDSVGHAVIIAVVLVIGLTLLRLSVDRASTVGVGLMKSPGVMKVIEEIAQMGEIAVCVDMTSHAHWLVDVIGLKLVLLRSLMMNDGITDTIDVSEMVVGGGGDDGDGIVGRCMNRCCRLWPTKGVGGPHPEDGFFVGF